MERKWKVLAVVSVAPFMGFLDLTVVNVAFPDIQRSFPASSLATLSWVLTGFNVVLAATLVGSGRLADRIGRKRTYVWALALFTVGSLAVAVAPSPGLLIAARLLQAIGASATIPTSIALVLVEFPREEQATAIGLIGAVGAVAAGLGPTVGGLLIDAASWRWAFWINIPIGILGIFAALRVLRESRDLTRGGIPDVVGIIAATASVGLLALALVKGNDWGWLSAAVIGCFVGTLLFGGLTVYRSAKHPVPVVELPLLRYHSFAVANLAVTCFAAGFFSMLLCSILFFTDVWGYSALEAGAAFTPVPVATAVVAGPAGRIADRRGHRFVIVPGALLFSAAMVLFALILGAQPAFTTEWLPIALLAGIGIGTAFPTFTSAATAALPPARLATGAAVMGAARQLGAAIGVASLVAIVGTPGASQALGAFEGAWFFAASAGFAAGLISLRLDRRIEPAPEIALAPASALAKPAHPAQIGL